MVKEAEAICLIGKRMYEKGFAVSNDGNISLRLSGDRIMITPSGVNKGFMSPEHMVITDMEGNVLETGGGKEPSSELKMHLIVYRTRSDINAVVHAHPVAASAFAIVGRSVDMKYMPEAALSLGTIPLAPYAKPSTNEVPQSIAPFIKGHNGALLSNHGAVAWAVSLTAAYDFMEQLEFYCKTVIVAESIGKPRSIIDDDNL